MKAAQFHPFLLQAGVVTMGCDGSIDHEEVSKLKELVQNEPYFLGYDCEEDLELFAQQLSSGGRTEIDNYLTLLETVALKERQQLALMRVVTEVAASDHVLHKAEYALIRSIRVLLSLSEEQLLSHVPEYARYISSSEGEEINFPESISIHPQTIGKKEEGEG